MKEYLKNLLPRVQQYSKSLDQLENFVEKPWILIDDENNRQQYIFRRDKSLIMSLNGKAQIGTWDYIPAAKSLFIDRGVDKILLNHAFVEKGLMILQMDGRGNRPWVLANEAEIPDLDVQKYLRNVIIRNLGLKTHTHNSQVYYYSDPNNTGINSSTIFYDEDFNQANVSFSLSTPVESGEQVYDITNGVVTKSYRIESYNTDRGVLKIQSSSFGISTGDLVFMNRIPAPSGWYKVTNNELYSSFRVEGGRLTELKETSNRTLIIVGCVVAFAIAFLLIINSKQGAVSSETTLTTDSISVTSTDTTNLSRDTTGAGTFVSSYSSGECKSVVTSLLDAMNKQDFASLPGFFSPVVEKYYNDRNLFNTDVTNNIQKYYNEVVSSGTVLYDTSTMVAGKDGQNYFVQTKQVFLSTKRNDHIPMVYLSNVVYKMTCDLKIKSVTGTIVDKKYDFLSLFAVPRSRH